VDIDYLKYISEGHNKNQILNDLMTSFAGDVWNFAFSLTCSPELADDITQEVFIKVFHKLETFRGESSVKSWLLSITRNTVYDHKRSAFIRKVTLVDLIYDKGWYPSAETEVIKKLAANEIWEKVLSLPLKLREVLILTGHHNLSVKEIAIILDVAEGTVKSRIHRARKKASILLETGELR
jgi:RNA polymerase sigma-70 factor, ECF subfamily